MVTTSEIQFDNGNVARLITAPIYADPKVVAQALGIAPGQPTIFMTGGASDMSDEDKARMRSIIEDGLARFAVEFGAVVIDGGTEAGVMDMVGEACRKTNHAFKLIGVAPLNKVTYPGKVPSVPDSEHVVPLENNHSHFVLVEADEWGAESDMIVGLSRAISAGTDNQHCGILVNGGKIARHDVFIATARGESAMPILVMEGSGRFADELATASRTGKLVGAILKAIVDGGKIELVPVSMGPKGLYDKLKKRFTQG